jgi:hypothetical protein
MRIASVWLRVDDSPQLESGFNPRCSSKHYCSAGNVQHDAGDPARLT